MLTLAKIYCILSITYRLAEWSKDMAKPQVINFDEFMLVGKLQKSK